MATYTLSYTGAEVNSAIGNAKDLFSKTNTWTGTQTFGTASIATANITTAQVSTLNVSGNSTFTGASQMTSLTVQAITGIDASFSGNLASTGTAEFNDVSIDGDVAIDGDLTINGEIASSLRVTGRTTFTDVVEAGLGIDNRAGISFWEGNEENFGAYMSFNHTAIASANMDGVYIDKTGIHSFSVNDPIPANVLLIYLDY